MGGRLKTLFLLHVMLMVYSFSGVLSKFAAGFPMFSVSFLALYAGIIAILGFYALAWQQFLRRLPLTTAFSNKAVTIVWGIVWGCVFFGESITFGKIIGAVLLIAGVVLFARADDASLKKSQLATSSEELLGANGGLADE